jgi:hypothetical protein
MRRVIGPLIVSGLLCIAAPAQASPESERAETLYATGKDAMARGDLSTACAAFAESLRLENAVGTLLNLATCEEKAGRLVAALEHFTNARAMLAKDDFRIPFATERIRETSRRIAHLTIRPRASDAGLKISTDGAPLPQSMWSVPRAVDPGAHEIVIEREGRPPIRIDVKLADGEVKVVDLEADKIPAAAPVREPSPPEPSGSRPSPFAWILGGIGVAGIATGSVTGVLAIGAANDYRDHCTNGECDPEGLDAARTGRTMSVVSPIAFAVGAVALVASVYLFITTPSRPSGISAR